MKDLAVLRFQKTATKWEKISESITHRNASIQQKKKDKKVFIQKLNNEEIK